MQPAPKNTPLLHSTETLGTETQVPRLGKGLLRWGEHDRDADLGLRRHRLGRSGLSPYPGMTKGVTEGGTAT